MNLSYPNEMPACRSLGRGKWRVLEPWAFRVNGVSTVIPPNFLTDLFSIPWPFTLALPRDQSDNRPALMHDWMFATGGLRPSPTANPVFSLEQTNAVLRQAAEECGLNAFQRHFIIRGLLVGSWKPWLASLRAGHSLQRPWL